jgi:hypothetical protein
MNEGAPGQVTGSCGTHRASDSADTDYYHCFRDPGQVCDACSRTRVAFTLPQLPPRPQRVHKGCVNLPVHANVPVQVAAASATVTQGALGRGVSEVPFVPVPVGVPRTTSASSQAKSQAGFHWQSSAGISESASATGVGSASAMDDAEAVLRGAAGVGTTAAPRVRSDVSDTATGNGTNAGAAAPVPVAGSRASGVGLSQVSALLLRLAGPQTFLDRNIVCRLLLE